jgi:hypothetical protein
MSAQGSEVQLLEPPRPRKIKRGADGDLGPAVGVCEDVFGARMPRSAMSVERKPQGRGVFNDLEIRGCRREGTTPNPHPTSCTSIDPISALDLNGTNQ